MEFKGITLSLLAGLTSFSAHANVSTPATEASTKNIEKITVIGTVPARYSNDAASTATRSNADLMDIARSVVVIPEQIILDQKITTVSEALTNVSGVSMSDGFGGTNDDFYLRGFRRDYVYRNGKRIFYNGRLTTTNIERVEVLKGPASVLYGEVALGGLVNVITKKPTDEFYNYNELTLDQHGKKHLLLDYSGPLTNDETLLYRLTGSLEDSEGFRDFSEYKRQFVSPSLQWNINDDHSILATYEYSHEDIPLDRGTLVSPNEAGKIEPIDTPVERRFGEKWEQYDGTNDVLDLVYNAHLNANWQAELSYNMQRTKAQDLQARPLKFFATDTEIAPGLIIPKGSLIRRADGTMDRDISADQISALLYGDISTLGVEHKLTVGADWTQYKHQWLFGRGQNETQNPALGQPLFNVYAPVYGNLASELSPFRFTKLDINMQGALLQDVITINEQLITNVGLRYDKFKVDRFYRSYTDGQPVIDNDRYQQDEYSDLTWQAGVIYKPVDELSLFASYATAFKPNANIELAANDEPQQGDQVEFGVKAALLDNNVNFTLAFYKIDKENIPVYDPSSSRPDSDYTLVGAMGSQGLEFDFTVRVVDGLNVIGNYAYTDVEITKDLNPEKIGTHPANVAKNMANIWLTYEQNGFGVGGGVKYVGDRFGDKSNTWELDDYTTVDLSSWYYLPIADDQVRFQVGVKNLTDTSYFPSAGNSLRVSVGQPRTFYASVAYQF